MLEVILLIFLVFLVLFFLSILRCLLILVLYLLILILLLIWFFNICEGGVKFCLINVIMLFLLNFLFKLDYIIVGL